MRVVIIGQQAFGKAALDAFLARGDTVAGVFAPPDADGRTDPLTVGARERGVPLFQFARYTVPEAHAALAGSEADIAVMAYVTAFVPQSFCSVPRYGTIQFHPSLLPLHRGPAAINWAVILGRPKTGLTIFRPTDGLDEGPVVLQKEVEIRADDTTGSVYFEKIFALGIASLIEAAELVVSGRAREWAQDESQATYEGWVHEAAAQINWAYHVDTVYNLIRGCNPSPGAWTTLDGRKLSLFEARKITARTFGQVRGKRIGTVVAADDKSFTVCAQGGFIEVFRCRFENGKKIPAGAAGIAAGTALGT